MVPYPSFISKRTLKPILWNLLLQTSFLSVFIFLLSVNIIHPVKWIYDWYVNFIWHRSCLYMFPLTVVVILLASSSTEDYVRIQPFYPNRISLFQQALTFHNIILCCLQLCIGFLLPWSYSSLLGDMYGAFVHDCDASSDKYCFSEKRLLLIESGLWISLIHFFHSHFFGTRYLKFPIAQLPKFVLIKSQFLDTFKNSIKWVIIPNVIFLIIYYLKLGTMNFAIVEKLGYRIEEPINSLSRMCDVPLITYMFIFSVLLIATVRFMEMFSRVYLTERFFFPFYTSTEKDIPSLTDGLRMSEFPIIQHLAFLDLMLLCNHNKSRREEIYKLSSFGGHPHLWNAIKECCTGIVNEFIDNLERSLSESSKLALPETKQNPVLKRNVPYYFADYDKRTMYSPSGNDEKAVQPSFRQKIVASRMFSFVFGCRQDMKTRHILRLSLPLKWACESMSFLACHSLKEDKFGVLVNDLPDMIALFLKLKHTLEVLLKRGALAASLSRQDLENIAEATALKKSVKRSIYRIVNGFKHYISDLQLPKDIENQLIPYIMYRD